MAEVPELKENVPGMSCACALANSSSHVGVLVEWSGVKFGDSARYSFCEQEKFLGKEIKKTGAPGGSR